MDKFAVDYNLLGQKVTQPKIYKLSEVKDQIEKVAWDVVRFKEPDGLDKLWIVKKQDNGEDVLVAMYEDEQLEKSASVNTNGWTALPNQTASHVNVFYKGEPIKSIALASVGVPSKEIHTLCRTLTTKLASDGRFRHSLLKDINQSEREELVAKYPELKV